MGVDVPTFNELVRATGSYLFPNISNLGVHNSSLLHMHPTALLGPRLRVLKVNMLSLSAHKVAATLKVILSQVTTNCAALEDLTFIAACMHLAHADPELRALVNSLIDSGRPHLRNFRVRFPLNTTSAAAMLGKGMTACTMYLSLADIDHLVKVASDMSPGPWQDCRELCLHFASFSPTTAKLLIILSGSESLRLARFSSDECISARTVQLQIKAIADTIKERLGVGHAETTPDLKFTAEYVACIGACGMAPVIMVNDDTFGSLTVQKMVEVLSKYQEMD